MPEANLTIDRAHAGDAEWVVDAQIAMAQESEGLKLDRETVRRGVARVFEEPALGFFVAARMQGESDRPVGCLMIQKEWSEWRAREVWWIHSVYVLPDFRRHGVFRWMFEFVKARASAENVAALRLYVDQENKSAQKAYLRLGMRNDHYALYELEI